MPPLRHPGPQERREPGIREPGLARSKREPVFLRSGPGVARHSGMTGTKDRVCMGVVGAPHGVRGAVRIKSFTDAPEAIANYGTLEDERGERCFTLRVIGPAKGDGMIIAAVSGVADRDRAEALRGLRLFAPRNALPEIAEDEFYHADLVGLLAVLADDTPVGRVIAVHDFGAGDVIEIACDIGPPALVPFTRTAVPAVDVAGGRLVIDPPEGLLDAPPRNGEVPA